jgi:GT2 family glycosyltransferase
VGAASPVYQELDAPAAKGYGLRFTDLQFNWEWLGWRGWSPHPAPLLGGFFLAMRRDVFIRVGGFDPGLRSYGMEDAELSLRLWTLGYACCVVPQVEVAHRSWRVGDYPHYQLDWGCWVHNALRTAAVHLSSARLARCVRAFGGDEALPAAMADVLAGGAGARRRHQLATRRYDDDWFFARFGMGRL